MPYTGNTYALPSNSVSPAVAGTEIDPSDFNAVMDDIETALTTAKTSIKLTSYTVATLPSASTSGEGSLAFVTDANATTARSVVAGGGSNKVVVFSDGTNWRIVA